ncbi:MAG: hypothetical protein P4L46_03560 [Fimbriimonas sp.]|nr:hypothetical protein [Fimbriimonas sp.]
MKHTTLWAAGGATFIAVAVLVVASPLGAVSKGYSQSRSVRIHAGKMKVLDEIEKGNLKAAETDALGLRALSPNGVLADSLLAPIYYKEGRDEESRVLYRKMILNPNGIVGDPDTLMIFGKLSEQTGHRDDAKLAYSRVIECYAYTLDQYLVADLSSKGGSVSDYHAVAHALDSLMNHQPGYIAEIKNSVNSAPYQPIPHFVYARLLDAYGHRRSANAELDRAAALLPKDIAPEWKATAYKQFGYDRWDHDSGGVIGKGGKVTFKVFKIPLTDSTKPLIDEPPTPVRAATP